MTDITRRIDLNLGYTCNINCRFCYYQQSMHESTSDLRRDLSTEKAKRWLSFFRAKGITAVDLTGGEPTIRKDIGELVRYARSIGYNTVCVISNGIRLADKAFAASLVSAGLNDALLSIHGPTAQIHENLTRKAGSYEKVISAIRNLSELGISCRTNTVVNGVSYRSVGQIACLLDSLGVKRINFILFNPIVEAQGSDADMNLTYAQAAPLLKHTIDTFRHRMDKITVRYMPLCLMRGYEEFVTNTAQIQYDPFEWDYFWRTYFRNGPFMWAGAVGLGFLMHPTPARLFGIGRRAALREAIKVSLAFMNKVHGPQCRTCAYRRICDGLWRDYARKQGFGELEAIEGPVLTDPAYFMASGEPSQRAPR